MMKKKLLAILASLPLSCVCLMAQRTYVDNGGVNSKLNKTIDLKRSSFNLDLGLGNAFEIGAHIQRNFNRIVSWDVLSARYARHFVEKNNQFFAMTGLRAFTPVCGKKKQVKFFFAIDLGYGGFNYDYWYDNPYYYNEKAYHYESKSSVWKSSFAFSSEVGFYLSKNFYLAASATHMIHNDGKKYNPYVMRIGYEF